MARVGGVLLAAATVAACGPNYAKLKVDEIQSVAVTADLPELRFCAYKPVALRAVVTYRNGKQARSRVPGERGRGFLRPSEFEWVPAHGEIDADAVLWLPQQALPWFDAPISVTARVIARPELEGEATLRPRFDCGGVLDFRGAAGARGGEAEDGGPGEAGPELEVALAYVDTQRSGRLVLVRTRVGDEPPEHYIVDPRMAGAQFVIDARGGDGGRGGQGVTGYPGMPGADGAPGVEGGECADGTPGTDGGDGTPGGPGGPGANGGHGGPGGRVVVRYDARFPDLPSRVQVLVDGGGPGTRGDPGPGGQGGRAGRGGTGGKGGVAPDCTPVDGANGANGTPGATGAAGPPGEPGQAGPPGAVRLSPEDVAGVFADEIGSGIPIAAGGGA